MRIPCCASLFASIVLAASLPDPAFARASATEAAQLGHELTPLGATVAGDSKIGVPAYVGAAFFDESIKSQTPETLEAMRAAIDAGVVDPAVVVIEARKRAHDSTAAVLPIGSLARFDRPPPTLTGYDDLLEA